MRKLIVFLLVFGVFSVSFAEDMAPLAMPSTRSLGMGGAHVAFTDDVYALFVNPAALHRTNQGSRFEVSPAFVGPFFELIDIIGDDDLTGALGDFAKDSGGKIPIGIDLRGPVSFAYVANGLGFGIWDRVNLDARVIGIDMSASLLADVIANFGMSFGILSLGNHEVDAGFVVKPFLRVKAGMNVTALDAIGGGLDNIVEKFNVPLIAGLGFDLGFMYRFHRDLSVGLTVDDIYTGGGRISTLYGKDDGVSSYRVPTTLNVGIAYTFQPIPWLGHLALMADYRDVTSLFTADDYTKRNPMLNLAFGAELSILQFIKARIGLNEMLPAAGLGVELGALQFNFAIYGKELSNEPGGFSTYALDLSFAIRPETKKANWPWSNFTLVNSILGVEESGPDRSAEAEAAASRAVQQL